MSKDTTANNYNSDISKVVKGVEYFDIDKYFKAETMLLPNYAVRQTKGLGINKVNVSRIGDIGRSRMNGFK